VHEPPQLLSATPLNFLAENFVCDPSSPSPTTNAGIKLRYVNLLPLGKWLVNRKTPFAKAEESNHGTGETAP
jgi:hypothetical protein